MSGRVGVAATDGHAGLRQPEFRADHMDDALFAPLGAEESQPVALRIALECRHHFLGERIRIGSQLTARRDDVIDRGERSLGHQHGKPRFVEHAECLGRSDLVNEVQPHEKLHLP